METGTETGTARAGWQGRNEDQNGKRGVRRDQGVQQGPGQKKGVRWSWMC